MSAVPGLRFCAALSGLRRFLDFVDLNGQPAADGSSSGGACRLHRPAGTLASGSATTTSIAESLLGKRSERSRCGHCDQVGDERTLKQLDESVAGIAAVPPGRLG